MRTPHSGRRPWSVLLAAVAVVAPAIAVALTVSAGPAAEPSSAVATAATEQLPPPSGDADTDAALTRCAKAVVRGHLDVQYPPPATWRATKYAVVGAAESELTVDDAFLCAMTPDTVILSGAAGTGVELVRMSPGKVVALNPQGERFTIAAGGEQQEHTERISVMQLAGGAAIEGVRVAEGDAVAAAVEPRPAQSVVDRALPLRTPDTDGPDRRRLGRCLARLPASTYTDPNLWIPFGGHDPDRAPQALVAAIGDGFIGYCLYDPVAGPTFVGAPRPAPGDRPQPVAVHHGRVSALLLTLPANGGNRVEIAPATGPAGARDCSILDHLAMCTLDTPRDPAVVVTAFTGTEPGGIEVYRG